MKKFILVSAVLFSLSACETMTNTNATNTPSVGNTSSVTISRLPFNGNSSATTVPTAVLASIGESYQKCVNNEVKNGVSVDEGAEFCDTQLTDMFTVYKTVKEAKGITGDDSSFVQSYKDAMNAL